MLAEHARQPFPKLGIGDSVANIRSLGKLRLQILDDLLDEQVPQRDAAEAVLAVRDGVEDGAVGDAGIDNR